MYADKFHETILNSKQIHYRFSIEFLYSKPFVYTDSVNHIWMSVYSVTSTGFPFYR